VYIYVCVYVCVCVCVSECVCVCLYSVFIQALLMRYYSVIIHVCVKLYCFFHDRLGAATDAKETYVFYA
jgi:hypothetical protein